MATSKKRSKRQNGSSTAPRSKGVAGAAQDQESVAQETLGGTDSAVTGKSSVDLRAEYTYVRKDVRHLAIVSLALFAVMLVIGFLI